MVAAGSSVEIVSPDRHVGYEVTGTAYPAYLRSFYEHGVRLTPDHRLTAVRRTADRRLEVDLVERLHRHRPTGGSSTRSSSSTARSRTTSCTSRCATGSSNDGELDLDAYLAGRAARSAWSTRPGATSCSAIGDAVASRNIHAALYEARRLALAL